MIKRAITDYFGVQSQNAIRIATCESGLNPATVGDTNLEFTENGQVFGYSSGIFQIRHLEGRPDPSWLLNPINNIEYAHQLYEKEGWVPWTCARLLGITK